MTKPLRKINKCKICGCLMLDSNRRFVVCSPCRNSMRDYNPRHDKEFNEKLLQFFIERKGECVSPQRDLGIDPRFRKAVQDSIRALRVQGHVIIAEHKKRGYTYVGADSEKLRQIE